MDRLGLVLGPADWRARALAVTALALTWISRNPDRPRTGVLGLGSILGLVTLVVPPLGRVPYLRRELTYHDHALRWLGLASTEDRYRLLGTLLDEAEPPGWWGEDQWIRDRLATRPDGSPSGAAASDGVGRGARRLVLPWGAGEGVSEFGIR